MIYFFKFLAAFNIVDVWTRVGEDCKIRWMVKVNICQALFASAIFCLFVWCNTIVMPMIISNQIAMNQIEAQYGSLIEALCGVTIMIDLIIGLAALILTLFMCVVGWERLGWHPIERLQKICKYLSDKTEFTLGEKHD